MTERNSARIESGYRIVGETKAYLKVPTFDSLQKMTVKELLSVPAIERLVSIKAVNFFPKFATQEGVLDLVMAITMIPLRLCEGVVKISGKHIKDTVEARSALLIIKESGNIVERRTKNSLFSFLIDTKSLFFDAMFTALDHIVETITEAKSLKERYSLINQYMDSLDAMMLSLEYIADTNTGAEILLDVLIRRYSMDTNHAQHKNTSLNPFIVLLDITYVNNFTISLLCKYPPIEKSFATQINDFLLHTHFIDIVFYYLLPTDAIEALQTPSIHDHSSSPCFLKWSYTLPTSFIDTLALLHSDTNNYNQVPSIHNQGLTSLSESQSQTLAHSNRVLFITEDVLAHAVELLCHIMACGNTLLIGSIIRYLPTAARILFSSELLSLLPLHNLKLICTFSSTSVSMILRVPRLYISEVLGVDDLQHQSANNNGTSKGPFTRLSLYNIIEHLATVAVSEEIAEGVESSQSSSESLQIIRNNHPSKLQSITFDKTLLPDEVESMLTPVYNVYIRILAYFIQYQMPKMVSERFDSAYLARVSVTMRHLASVFCILDDIGKMLYLSANSSSTESLTIHFDGDTLNKRSRFDYRYCGRIPWLGTISTTCPESINLYETYMIKEKILSPSPLSIFACVFPPQKYGKNPLLTLQLMLFNIKTGQQTIIKHYVTRILSSIIVFAADSTELFKRVVSDIKLSAFLPSISIKKNKNPFCNLVCEMLLRVCLRCNDMCWKLYREQLSGYYRNREADMDDKKELLYPLSLSNINQLLADENADSLVLIRPLMTSSDFVTYVLNILEADHNKYIKIRNSTILSTCQSVEQ